MTSAAAGRIGGSSVRPITRRDPPGAARGTLRDGLRATLRTADGVAIDAGYEPGAGGPEAPAIVVAHGFTGHLERPHVRRAAGVFARYGAVVTFSFRGHGKSGGRSTVGDREVLDLAAAVRWARSFGHARVVTVGFSMGGSVVLRHAALGGGSGSGAAHEGRAGVRGGADGVAGAPDRTDGVVSVSAPARWYYRGTAPMRRLHWVVTRPLGRAVGRHVLGTRIQRAPWDPVPLSPVAAVPLIAPTPLLVVHGGRDPYFPLDHPRMLASAAADGGAELWLEPEMGHAEHAADDALLARIGGWAAGRA
ncbi:alpha/beta hydrolase [Streptomyces sp. O3]